MTPRHPRTALPQPSRDRRGHAARLAALLSIAAVLAGCSDQAKPAQDNTAAGPTPGPGVPSVAKPLDLTPLKRNPCDALKPSQDALDPAHAGLFGNGIPAKPSSAGSAPACAWTSRATLIVYVPADTDTSLTAIYAMKGGQFPVVTPLAAIDGYPVVAYGTDEPLGSHGECRVALAASDTQTVVAWLTQPTPNTTAPSTCDTARSVLEHVLRNLTPNPR